ncbi:glycerate kinase [Streptomyces ochraceiscleroticus]|uniref:Glycerate kinase n=1 Tax=Streptomyces ochraceiscleroticus TaxID=47761 RepID=A0ABW1MRC1_9ACTN|nr:glycerate kinase [Streptomyces ochraceiscleroticus]
MTSVLIAPDKFKGSLTADEVATALEAGLLSQAPGTHVRRLPLADGGEGSVAAARAAGFITRHVTVTGPTGQPVTAALGFRGGTVVIEAAQICGLGVLPEERKAPLTATSYGLGEAIRYAIAGKLNAGTGTGTTPDTIVLALGGVATTDGGAGMLQALGAYLHRAGGEPVGRGGAGLGELATADLAPAVRALTGTELVITTDVDNRLLGPRGAAAVYGPQKGANDADVRLLDDCLDRFVRVLEQCGTPHSREAAAAPGSGAAGGLGYAARLLGGRVRSGADYFLTLLGADRLLDRSDFVITGEGSLDEQSLSGKLPVALARRAQRRGVPVHAVAGRCTLPDSRTHPYFRSVQALADLTDEDSAHDSALSARLLSSCGQMIADRWIGGTDR